MKSSLASLPVSVLVLLALPLRAQGAPPSAPPADLEAELSDILATDQIGAASKHVQDVASAPADVVVLRSSELKALGYRTLGDALGGVLGFRTNEDHAYQGLASAGVYTLGDQNTRILVLLDGHALNSPAEVGSSKVGEDFGLPLELVDHIEVVRGPASSLYGNNAYQALINVVSMSAAGDRQSPTQAAVTAGSGGLAEIWAQQVFSLGGVTSSLMLSGYQRTGTAQDYPQLQPASLPAGADREERQNAYLYVKGRQWSFAASLLSRTQRLASAPYASVPGDPGNAYRNRRMSGEFKWEPVTANIHWMARLFGDRNEFDDAFVAQNPPGQLELDADPDRSLGGELQGRAVLSDSFTLTFGTEQQWHRYNGLYTDPGDSIGTDVSYTLGNTYLEGNWQPTDRWNLVAGVQRADWRPSQAVNSNDGAIQPLGQSDISRYTPRLSVIWNSGAKDVLKFIFGQGFRMPTIYEEYYTDGQFQFANTELKPEVLTSEQLTWARKWTPQLSSTASVMLYRSRDAIFPVSNAQDVQQFQNAPDPIKGTAGQLEVAWHQGGTELSGGVGTYDVTYQDAALPDSTRWLGNLKAIQHLGDWSLAGEARYVGGRSNSLTASGVPATVPANWTLRASVRRECAWGWSQISLEDLTNSRRQDLVAPEYAPITWMKADGRAVNATLGVRF